MAKGKNNKTNNKNSKNNKKKHNEKKQNQVVNMVDKVEELSDKWFLLKRNEYQQRNKKPNSKEIKRSRNFNRNVMNKAYDRNEVRYGKTKEELKGLITNENTYKSYVSQVNDYTDWVAKTYHITDRKMFRPWMYDDYCNEKIKEFHEKSELASERGWKPPSPAKLLQQRAAIKKYEQALENYHVHQTGEEFNYRLYSEKRSTGENGIFEKNGITRDLEDVSQGRPLITKDERSIVYADHESFHKVYNKLMEVNPEFAKLWRHQGMAGQRIDAAMNTRKEDIVFYGIETGVKTEVGKAGKRYETSEINLRYLRELEEELKGYADGRLIFDSPKKQDGNDKKFSTFKTEYNEALRKVGEELGLDGISSHTARRYYAQSLYDYYVDLSKEEFKEIMAIKGEKYERAFTKDRMDLNRKRMENSPEFKKIPKGKRPLGDQLKFALKRAMDEDLAKIKEAQALGLDYKPRYIHSNDELPQERKAALISSVETGHERISIMAHYISRRVAKKQLGGNVWFKNESA